MYKGYNKNHNTGWHDSYNDHSHTNHQDNPTVHDCELSCAGNGHHNNHRYTDTLRDHLPPEHIHPAV